MINFSSIILFKEYYGIPSIIKYYNNYDLEFFIIFINLSHSNVLIAKYQLTKSIKMQKKLCMS